MGILDFGFWILDFGFERPHGVLKVKTKRGGWGNQGDRVTLRRAKFLAGVPGVKG